ncbi:hypothetical protein JB92DRAFT_1401909 [Gautieria morchelliformis]|nr:hypothetical protein JB92DRAFT_1401909 [Gautieria morchelliformis]
MHMQSSSGRRPVFKISAGQKSLQRYYTSFLVLIIHSLRLFFVDDYDIYEFSRVMYAREKGPGFHSLRSGLQLQLLIQPALLEQMHSCLGNSTASVCLYSATYTPVCLSAADKMRCSLQGVPWVLRTLDKGTSVSRGQTLRRFFSVSGTKPTIATQWALFRSHIGFIEDTWLDSLSFEGALHRSAYYGDLYSTLQSRIISDRATYTRPSTVNVQQDFECMIRRSRAARE